MAGMIRATHPHALRSGEWAVLEGAICDPHSDLAVPDRPCYIVRFEDGEADLWLIDDLFAGYEFA